MVFEVIDVLNEESRGLWGGCSFGILSDLRYRSRLRTFGR